MSVSPGNQRDINPRTRLDLTTDCANNSDIADCDIKLAFEDLLALKWPHLLGSIDDIISYNEATQTDSTR